MTLLRAKAVRIAAATDATARPSHLTTCVSCAVPVHPPLVGFTSNRGARAPDHQGSQDPSRALLPGLRLRSAAAFCVAALAAVISLAPGLAAAPADPSQICEGAALQASRDSGVPLDVLRAISLTETGRRHAGGFRPWPWTVNMQGKGVWFDSPDEALAFVERKFGTGARSFDVGCFQINYKWHGQAFDSIAQMFEPAANARYAANLLRSLHGELGSWSAAAGAYHSRTPEFATRYRDRFDRIRARLTGQPSDDMAGTLATGGGDGFEGGQSLPGQDGVIPEIPDIVMAMYGGMAQPAPPRVNRFPLLQQAGPFAPVLGSLVPPSTGPVVALLGNEDGQATDAETAVAEPGNGQASAPTAPGGFGYSDADGFPGPDAGEASSSGPPLFE
jgi:hypothetical protein